MQCRPNSVEELLSLLLNGDAVFICNTKKSYKDVPTMGMVTFGSYIRRVQKHLSYATASLQGQSSRVSIQLIVYLENLKKYQAFDKKEKYFSYRTYPLFEHLITTVQYFQSSTKQDHVCMKDFLKYVHTHIAVGSTHNHGAIFTLLFLIRVYTTLSVKFCNYFCI